MRELITYLCTLLTEQKVVLEGLLKLAVEEQTVIIEGNFTKLEEIVRTQLKQLNTLKQIEKKRATLHELIASKLGMSSQDLTVSIIADKVTSEQGAQIRQIQSQLMSVIDKHGEINAENRELINAHLEYSQLMLELMIESDDPLNNLYGGDGRAAPDKKSTGFFNGQA